MKKISVITGKEIAKIIGASLIGMAIITWFNYGADLYVFRFSIDSMTENISERFPEIISKTTLENPTLPENEELFRHVFNDIKLSGRIDVVNILNTECNLIWSSSPVYEAATACDVRTTLSEINKRGVLSRWLTGKDSIIHRIGSAGHVAVVHAPIIFPSSTDAEGIIEVFFNASDINLLWTRLRIIKMAFAGTIILAVIISFYFIFKKRSSEISAKLESYATIVREAPMGIYLINKYGVIETFNPKMVELSGAKSASQVIGLNVFKMSSYKEVGLDRYFKEGLTGKPFDLETPYVSYTGRKKSYRHYLGSPILSEDRTVEKLLLMVEDITIRKELGIKLSEEKTRLLASIDSLLLGFVILDVENNIVVVNPAFKEISKTGEEVSFEKVTSYWRPAVDLEDQIKRAASSKEVVELSRVKHEGGFFRIIVAPVIPQLNETAVVNSAIGSVVVIEDITEKELLEESKKDFIAITSHEMRTPLSIIRGAAERLLKVCSKINAPEEAHSMATYIDDSSIRLLDIVNKLLDVAALEGKTVQFLKDLFDVNELIAEVTAEFKPKSDDKGLKLDASFSEKPLKTIADRDKTREILGNLLANAIQYTETGGIKISSERSDKFIKISFSDTGVGVPPEMKELIFQKFRSVHDQFMKSKEYGSGMGLYISRTMAENMGGRLFLEKSSPGKGSTFTLLLPAAVD